LIIRARLRVIFSDMGNIRLDSGGQKVHFGRVEGLMTKVSSLPSFYGGIIEGFVNREPKNWERLIGV
jgi:hypothetical protein